MRGYKGALAQRWQMRVQTQRRCLAVQTFHSRNRNRGMARAFSIVERSKKISRSQLSALPSDMKDLVAAHNPEPDPWHTGQALVAAGSVSYQL